MVSIQGVKHKFHLIPSGILNSNSKCVIGNGVVVHLRGLVAELKSLKASGIDYKDRFFISDRAHIVFDFHQEVADDNLKYKYQICLVKVFIHYLYTLD